MQAEWSYTLNISREVYYWTFIDNFTFLKSYKLQVMVTRYHEVIKLRDIERCLLNSQC